MCNLGSLISGMCVNIFENMYNYAIIHVNIRGFCWSHLLLLWCGNFVSKLSFVLFQLPLVVSAKKFLLSIFSIPMVWWPIISAGVGCGYCRNNRSRSSWQVHGCQSHFWSPGEDVSPPPPPWRYFLPPFWCVINYTCMLWPVSDTRTYSVLAAVLEFLCHRLILAWGV